MVDRGVVIVPESHKVFVSMTVEENLRLSARQGRRRREPGADGSEELVRELFPALSAMLARKAGALSGGERQMLAIARALLLAPRLLVVDELSLGLAPVIVDDLLVHLRRINEERGVTILMAEQSSIATEIAHRAVVIEAGTTRWEGDPRQLDSGQELTERYLGTDVANA
jgi:branched-chain amino acid transport system ATP-binding protein